MVLPYDPHNDPVMKAAQLAFAAGNVNHILIWTPEELKNALKNI